MRGIGNTKYYINYERNLRECGECHKIMGFEMFSLCNKFGKPRSRCKKCRSVQVMESINRRRIEKQPDSYHQCDNDECLNVWRKTKGLVCKKCGSLRAIY